MRAEARAAGLLLLVAAAALLLAFQAPGDIFLDFGPNDGRYVRGFREDFEVDEPTLIHWTSDRSEVRLPFELRGPYGVTLRFKRHIEEPAELRLFLGGELVETLIVPQQDFSLRTFHWENAEGGPFELDLVTTSADRRPLGVALDWMSVAPSRGLGAVLPTTEALLWMLSWVLSFFLLARIVGASRPVALALGGLVLAALVSMAIVHKLWPVHLALTLGVRAHAVMLVLALVYLFRRRSPQSAFARPLARWAVLFVALGMAVRLFALFHPDFFYPDVRTHSKFVSLLWTEGLSGFLSHHIENQHRHLLGLQYVSGRWVAFPYPPLLYLTIYPLSRLELPVDDWMKLVPTALLAVEGLMVFALAGKLGLSERTSVLAVALHSTARVAAFRLAVASYAALYGHFWDVAFALYLTFSFERLSRPRYGVGLGALAAVSLLSYAGSALVLGLFVPFFCLAVVALRPRPRGAIVAATAVWSLAGAIAAVVSFYAQYLPELFPTLSAASSPGSPHGGLVDFELTPIAALSMAAHRFTLFYAWPYALASLGVLLALVLRRPSSPGPERLAVPLALATSATYLGMNFLRAGLGSTHIFQFSKDDLVILPLVAILVAGLIHRLAAGGTRSRFLAAGLLTGWIVWGGTSLAADVRGRFLRPDYPPATGAVSGGEDDLVSPGPFRPVEGLVRELEQLNFVRRLVRKSGEAEARGERTRKLPETRVAELAIDARAKLVRDPLTIVGVGPVQKYGELVPAETRDQVARAKPFLQNLPHFPQDVVSGAMSQVVVHLLEPVEVEQQQAQRRLVATGASDFGLDLALEVRVVPEPGEMVEVGHELRLS
jgi:hypothetical protein